MTDTKIFKFLDLPRGKEPSVSQLAAGNVTAATAKAIIIDNGSYECRSGLAVNNEPELVFKNLAIRQKGRNGDSDNLAVGRDIENLETLRSQLKSPFDRNVVTQFDTQEMIFDYIFTKLGVGSQEKVDHPVVMSEPVANPNHCRKFMSELMFECYCVPSLTYYTDALGFWYDSHHDTPSFDDGVMVSIGYQNTHIVPVIGGQMDLDNTKRIAIGGYHLDYFMQRLLQLKYPIHSNVISLSRAEEVVQNHTFIAEDFREACNQWIDIPYYEKMVRRMQLPYGNVPANFAAVALQGERQAERAKLMKEKQALEKLEDKKHIFDQLCEIREMTGNKLHKRLAELNVDSPGELQCHIKAVQATVEDLKRKITMKDMFNNGTLTKEWLQEKIDYLDNPDIANDFSTFDIAEYYQLHIGLEQIRVPELLFQPSMVGIEQGGISETLVYVLNRYPEEKRLQLANNVLVAGGCASIPGVRERIEYDLRSSRPFESKISTKLSQHPCHGSWHGARQWYNDSDRSEFAITKALYEENGGDYLIEHQLSNKYYPTPVLSTTK